MDMRWNILIPRICTCCSLSWGLLARFSQQFECSWSFRHDERVHLLDARREPARTAPPRGGGLPPEIPRSSAKTGLIGSEQVPRAGLWTVHATP